MAVDIRPAYSTKLRYALRYASLFWFVVPAFFVAAVLDVYHNRWESFAYAAVLLIVVPPVIAAFWAAHVADIPKPETTWRQIGTTAAVYSVVIVGLAVVPYFRYVYVHVGATIVRVDRLTGSQCPAPFMGCGYSQPNDPIVRYDEKTGTWRPVPGGKTVRDLITGR